MKKLLACVDFSDSSENAVEYAKRLSTDFDAGLIVYHAFELPLIDPYAPLHMYEEVCKNERDQVEAKLKKLCVGNECSTVAEQSDAVGGVVGQIKSNDPSLVVLGTAGHSMLKKIFGSTTVALVNNVDVPLLVVPEEKKFNAFKRILIATDFSKVSDESLQLLKELGNKYKSEFIFQHISKEKMDEEEKANFYLLQDDINNRFGYDKVRYDLMKYEGVYEGMNLLIDTFEPDLLVIFKYERPFWESIFHKSFTEKMIFDTNVPLLIFH
jgi:nucleotide-binding universal stress UspA family protein